MNAGADDPASVIGGDLAARDAAALALGLAGLLEQRVLDEQAVDPDLRESTIARLRSVGTELARVHHQHDLLEQAPAPVEGTALASQIAVLLSRSEPRRPSSTGPTGSVNDSEAATATLLDQSGIESNPASDPPSR